jgi:chromosome segregation ATPase
MANDNNKNNSLTTESDSDPTSELESLDLGSRHDADFLDSSESDQDTFDFDRLEGLSELSEKSIADLKSDIRTRNESINRLQFDIEQLRARWSGLESEIAVREDLTDRLNEQLSETQRKLARTESLLSERESDIDSLRASLKDKNSLLSSVEIETQNIADTVESGKSVISDLQTKITEQQQTIKKLDRNIASIDTDRKAADDALAERDAQVAGLETKLSRIVKERDAYVHDLSRSAGELSESLQQTEKLRAAIVDDRTPHEIELNNRIEDQNGLIARNRQELRELKQQILRTESYADELRFKVQDEGHSSSDANRNKNQMAAALADATEDVREMKEELEKATTLVSELEEQSQQLQSEFDDEVRKIRFELGGAEETIAGHESVNQQLASDLIDNNEYRQALESQLESSSKKNHRTIRDLNRQLKKQNIINEDIERQLENKDNAIAALLNELASRSRTIESIGEIENVIHEIDGRMSDRIDDKSASEKDRMARLLIGNVDGQELQFPLFKQRLTIGRTAHNDIQLKAHFISRRHAVIVTENEQTRIIDWGSKNGVYVNDSRIAEQKLKNGDIVAIGTAEFRYEERPKR